MAIIDIPVLIVGAGPVGLTLAMRLAKRGIRVCIAELRHRGEPPSVKCNHVSARSMEIFRRLGVAGKVRDAGLPPDYPQDVSYRTTTTGIELARIPIPSRLGRLRGDEGPDTWWPTPEPPHRINQTFLEPILFDHAAAMPAVSILNRVVIDSCKQTDQHVTAIGRNLDSGEKVTIRAEYLIGCDGGKSTIRKAIGAKLLGAAVVQRVQSTHIRAPQLIHLISGRPAWAMFSLNPRRCGNVYAIDGRETWLIHNYLKPDEMDFEAIDRDRSIRTILGVGEDFRYEIISKEDWIGRRLIADRFRDRRIFLCGDAAHIWVPYAGYGMNAGIADADNLAWLLAARLQGWAPEAILDAYEEERLPITDQVSRFAMGHAEAMAKQRLSVPAEIESPTAEGERARAALGRAAYDLNVQQYCCGGLNFGYFYDGSSIIAYDGESAPSYTMAEFTPSTVPGCRAPHFWLSDGRSLYDALGEGYTLLRLDSAVDVSGLESMARRRGAPLLVLDLAPEAAPPVYDRKLVLVRPDQHVAWRGDRAPANPAALIDLVRGAGAMSSRSKAVAI